MARERHSIDWPLRPLALLIGGPFLLSACAFAGGMTPQEADVRSQFAVDQYMPASRDMRDNIETQELFAQAAFWSHEYELNPTDLEATLKLASAVRKLGNPARAVEITQTARQIHPRDPYLLAEHAAGLVADQRAMDALPVLDDALRIAPGYARLWSLRGAALDQMEDYDAARGHYDRALQITPNDPNILTNLGLSYALSGDLRASEMWLRRAAALPGAGPNTRQNLALVLQLQGRTEEAQREQRLAGLSRGDRKLPPAPVPALTPRGMPAQMSPQQQMPSYQTSPTQESPAPIQNFRAPQNPQAYSAYPPSGQGASRSPFAPRAKAPTTQQAPAPLHGGMPQTRLSTMGANGQAFASASEAARQAAAQQGTRNQIQPAQPGTFNYGQPMTSQQQSVLDNIRQSLQPGPVGPQPQQGVPTGPQPHVVGPALMQPGQGYAPQQGQPVYGNYGQQPYPQVYAPQGGYQAPVQQPTAQGPARDRRR
ncbi:MAG: tetratricopeptide repeat protein [Pseudomonadota bacterium]